MSIGAELEH